MDPFQFIFPENHDLILRHFSARELKNLTLVSKSWNENVSSSRSFNQIVPFIYHEDKEDFYALLSIFLENERNYKNITLNLNNFSFADSFEKCPTLSFTSVKYSYGILPMTLAPITKIEENVKLLDLNRIICETEEMNFDNFELKFPRLEKLSLHCNYGNINLIFKNCENLKFLNFHQRSNVDSNEVLARLLRNNKKLENLRLNLKHAELIKEAIADSKFKLKKLTFESDENFSQSLKQALCKILKTQKNSIENLIVDRWCGLDALQNIFNMPKLKSLSINIDHGDENIFDILLPSNPSVITLSVEEAKPDSVLVRRIFKSVPNLKVYKTVLMLHEEMLELEKRCKNLEEIYAENFYVNSIPKNFFGNIKKFRTMDVDDELCKSLNAKTCEERSHFENLVYFGYYVNTKSF